VDRQFSSCILKYDLTEYYEVRSSINVVNKFVEQGQNVCGFEEKDDVITVYNDRGLVNSIDFFHKKKYKQFPHESL